MKSVDKLRNWADGLRCVWIDQNDHSIIVTTCDDMPPSIDCVNLREHVNGILDGIEREAADMVPLPLDADGVPIHIGDVMDGYSKTIEVMELRYGRSGWVIVSRDGNAYVDCAAFTHHHAQTIEDVLREFAEKITDSQIPGMHPTYEEAIAEYAAKLTLRGDE